MNELVSKLSIHIVSATTFPDMFLARVVSREAFIAAGTVETLAPQMYRLQMSSERFFSPFPGEYISTNDACCTCSTCPEAARRTWRWNASNVPGREFRYTINQDYSRSRIGSRSWIVTLVVFRKFIFFAGFWNILDKILTNVIHLAEKMVTCPILTTLFHCFRLLSELLYQYSSTFSSL